MTGLHGGPFICRAQEETKQKDVQRVDIIHWRNVLRLSVWLMPEQVLAKTDEKLFPLVKDYQTTRTFLSHGEPKLV